MLVQSGTIHALLGENGAGKSTLNHIISGALKADSGNIELGGSAVNFTSPLEAAAAGVGMVHQHFLLAEALTVAENIALGMRRSALGLRFNASDASAHAAELAEQTGLHVDPDARVADLSVGMRQRVEILKALARGARLLLLDEPTAVLAPAEVERLFATLRKLRDDGRTIVIVTHKLDEIFALAGAVTVLRRGATVLECPIASTSRVELARAMIGREPPRLNCAHDANTSAPVVFELRNVEIPGALNAASLEIRAGEVAGVAGVEGSGQSELAGLIDGTLEPVRDIKANSFKLNGCDLREFSIAQRSSAGIASIPADRQRDGLVTDLTLAENLSLRKPPAHGGLIDMRHMFERAAKLAAEFNVVPPAPDLRAGSFSGGNQQKALVARELSSAPKLVVACNPTRGLDVGATVEIQNRLLSAAREHNAAVLLISSDLDEVLELSDHVYALYKGALIDVGRRGVSRETVGRAMVGAGEPAAQ